MGTRSLEQSVLERQLSGFGSGLEFFREAYSWEWSVGLEWSSNSGGWKIRSLTLWRISDTGLALES